jgi:hypothetical protein
MKKKKKVFTLTKKIYTTKENTMAKKSKKITAAIAAGLAAYGASKMLGRKGAGESAMDSTYDEAGVKMLRPEDTSARARIRSIGRRKMYQDMPMSGQDEMFGLGAMDGAKYGKMMKAKGGKFSDYVKEKSGSAVSEGELKKLKKQYLQEKTGSATTESEMRNILGAKHGTMVMARGQRLGRKKPTKIC